MQENTILEYEKIKDTYIAYLKQNFLLTKSLINKEGKNFVAYNSDLLDKFFKGRALHLQSMSLIGVTAEHLVKLILAKRGFVLNKVSHVELDKNNHNTKVVYSHMLIGFRQSIELLTNSNDKNYFNSLKSYVMNPYPDIYDKYSYFGRKIIDPKKCLLLLANVRNSYLHYANAQGEQNGIIWYLYNFLAWIAKKEFPEFKNLNYIGSKDVKDLFTHKKGK